MAGCRDCRTCTRPGQGAINVAVGLLHVSSAGITYLVKRLSGRHCPQCRHKLTSHQRLESGAFAD